jgi:nucleoside 2-deoxyribosyltransferase
MQSQRTAQVKHPMAVVGGFYRELCRFPFNDETWGSGGRAAATIAGLGIETEFFTAVDANHAGLLASLGHIFHFKTNSVETIVTPRFQYDHALSTPLIWPPMKETDHVQFTVEAREALVFGMLEATPIVKAERLVYDPQNPHHPLPFVSPANNTSRLAYVLNSTEAKKLAAKEDLFEAAQQIESQFGAEVVVIKCGPWGVLIREDGRNERIAAYETKAVMPIGSGDVFAATFAARWAREDLPAIEAAQQASRAAAVYVTDHILPIEPDRITVSETFEFLPLKLTERPLAENEYHVYLAGPFFNIGQTWLVEESRLALQAMGLKVFSPCHDVGIGGAHEVAPKDLDALRQSRSVFALVDGLDAGTIFEIGYARARDIPVVALAQSTADEPLKMILGSGCDIVSDFVTAIYRTSWACRRE